MRRGRTIALAVVAAVAVAGCGKQQSGGSGGAQPVKGLTLPPVSADINVKPVIPKPKGEPPAGLQVRDVLQGGGNKVAETGDTLSVQYVGASWSSGQQFDSSWDRGKRPFKFELGSGTVIPGWDQGLVGMKQGGRRELVIPPNLAYGAQGQPPAIGPNETLVFVIDLQKVKKSG